jgi:hypothetical protein
MIARPLLVLVCGCTLAGPVVAGSLDAPAAPTASGSAMYTLQDLYNRLNAGTAGVPRPGAFVEPAAGPGATMRTVTDIMAKMPALDNANGAAANDVLSGKTFWGLTGGAWGVRTGTLPTQTLSATSTTVNAGYYAAITLNVVDSDLAPGNIKSGTTIFGVLGAYTGSGGTTSAPFPVAKTGQTTSYATGDDGALQKGAAWPSPRFTASNGAVTDNLTGLVWLRNANCDGAKQWAAALTWAATLASGNCGLSDGSVAGQWRLPSIKELSSLVNAGAVDPALPAGHPFTGVQSSYYWSSTPEAPYPSSAWGVYLVDGYMAAFFKTSGYYVWPVRDGL